MLKIYGSMLCPDCVRCCEELKNAEVPFEYCDFCDSLRNLKEFLKLREIADADCRPLSQYINLVLKKHIEELDSK